jgi:hypothetical protein
MFIQALRQFETLRMSWHIAQAGEVITQADGATI